MPGFNSITFCENSNYWQESLLDVIRQSIAGDVEQTFPPIIWIFTEGEGDGIESRLPFKNFSTLPCPFRGPNYFGQVQIVLDWNKYLENDSKSETQ